MYTRSQTTSTLDVAAKKPQPKIDWSQPCAACKFKHGSPRCDESNRLHREEFIPPPKRCAAARRQYKEAFQANYADSSHEDGQRQNDLEGSTFVGGDDQVIPYAAQDVAAKMSTLCGDDEGTLDELQDNTFNTPTTIEPKVEAIQQIIHDLEHIHHDYGEQIQAVREMVSKGGFDSNGISLM